MGQDITLKIAGPEFQLKAATPEMESLMRFAADDINNMLARYDEKYPDKQLTEKLLFVTLTQAVSRLTAQGKLNALTDSQNKLNAELSAYLNNIDTNR